MPESSSRRHRNSLLGIGNFPGYGSVFGGSSVWDNGEDSDEGDGEVEGDGRWTTGLRKCARGLRDLWLEPKQVAVGKVIERWWMRWIVLAVFPAILVCSLISCSKRPYSGALGFS